MLYAASAAGSARRAPGNGGYPPVRRVSSSPLAFRCTARAYPAGAATELPAPLRIAGRLFSTNPWFVMCLSVRSTARSRQLPRRVEALSGAGYLLIAQGALDLNLQLVCRRFDGVVIAGVTASKFVHAPLLVLLHVQQFMGPERDI